MLILIVGLLEFDSGKTSITVGLIHEALGRGINAIGMKPIGAHSGWYQYDTLERSMRIGVLVGEDAYKIWMASKCKEPIEVISPIDILTAPPDPDALGLGVSYLNQLCNVWAQMVLVRLPEVSHDSTKIASKHYLALDNILKLSGTMRKIILKLASEVKATALRSKRIIGILFSRLRVIDNIIEYLDKKYDIVFIESFNNATHPAEKALEADRVILVAPCKAYVYDGKDYAKVIKSFDRSRLLYLTTKDIIPYLRPIFKVEIMPRKRTDIGSPGLDLKILLNSILSK